jgi:branched-chain amino acid aminotransferase
MYYLNGHYVKEEDAKISILDLSILRGFGVFDYLRTYGGRPFHLQDHLLRLQYSAEHIALPLPNSLDEIETIVHTVLGRNNLDEASIKILVTGGVSPDQFTPHPNSHLIVFAYPLTTYPSEFFTDGIKVITTRLSRSLATSKTTQYTPAIVALQRGKAQNAQEALYVNAREEILEATTSNFFAFKEGVLYTCCSEEVLLGMTQDVVLKLAAPHFPISTRALHSSEISSMEEAFITSSTREVMPVVQIDSLKIGNGLVGPKTQKIMALFRAYTEAPAWTPLNIPRYSSGKLFTQEGRALLL